MDSKNQESMFDKLFNSGKTLFEDISKKVRQSDFFKQGTCYICGKPLIGIYYKDLYGRKICTSHQRRTCISCGGFCNDSAMEISPGKYLCSHCQHYRTSLADAKHIIKLIRKHYLSIGLGEISPVWAKYHDSTWRWWGWRTCNGSCRLRETSWVAQR